MNRRRHQRELVPKSVIDTLHKRLLSVLRTKDDVILADLDEMISMMEWTVWRHFHVIIVPQGERNVKKNRTCVLRCLLSLNRRFHLREQAHVVFPRQTISVDSKADCLQLYRGKATASRYSFFKIPRNVFRLSL